MGIKFHLSSTETETEDEVTLRLRRLLETAHLVKFLVELILVALGLVLSWRFGWLVFAIVAAVILAAYLRLWPSKDARAEKPPVHEPRDVEAYTHFRQYERRRRLADGSEFIETFTESDEQWLE